MVTQTHYTCVTILHYSYVSLLFNKICCRHYDSHPHSHHIKLTISPNTTIYLAKKYDVTDTIYVRF